MPLGARWPPRGAEPRCAGGLHKFVFSGGVPDGELALLCSGGLIAIHFSSSIPRRNKVPKAGGGRGAVPGACGTWSHYFRRALNVCRLELGWSMTFVTRTLRDGCALCQEPCDECSVRPVRLPRIYTSTYRTRHGDCRTPLEEGTLQVGLRLSAALRDVC